MTESPTPAPWRRCTTCKKDIEFGAKFWTCSVSTCNRVRTGLTFCSVECFDAHIPVMNHKDAGAIEHRAPTVQAYLNSQKESPNLDRSRTAQPGTTSENEPLVVVSKVKGYIRTKSGYNTSDHVIDILSDHIRRSLDEAIQSAQEESRKTLLDRDVKK